MAMLRRLDDRIKDLCAKAVATRESPELDEILRQLQKALREHSKRTRDWMSNYPASHLERRSTKQS